MLVFFLAGAAGLVVARWMHPVAEADASLADGAFENALARYAIAEARFDAVAPVRHLLHAEYDRIVSNQLWLLYRLGRYDDVIEKAQGAPEGAEPHFWSGSAFFAKAQAEQKPEARLDWMNRAEEELRRAVEASPADWDVKYDFELVTRLAGELRKKPKTPPTELMRLLRPQPGAGAKPVRRVG